MLNIYRASAGAGKTHLLTGEYIKLLFRKDLQPENADHETQFDEILAVTFTNKSTAEMKARIVKELHKLTLDPAKSDYYEAVRQDGNGNVILSDALIRSKALYFLTSILNNYSDFAISTIDSFFQKVVRSFARELNLQCNYEVELNSNRILDAATSVFLDKLDRTHRKTLFEWMMKFSQKKIEDGEGWRIEKDLKNLAKAVLTSENYRTRSERIRLLTQDKVWMSKYIDMLNEIIRSTKKEITEMGKDGMDALNRGRMTENDFKGGTKGKMRILVSWANGDIVEPDETVKLWSEDENEWYTKTHKGAKLPEAETAIVKNLLSKAVSMKQDNKFVNYNTAKIIIENIYQLGILADLDTEVNRYCNEEGTMLLASTTEMLNKLIGEDEAPFIYEKTGTHIQSFMIDEFQDTSEMQWRNFKPLIDNSLANGRQNLIVGDVKQSIYRWRGSDWGLLHSGLKKDFNTQQSHEDCTELDTNYRSLKNIIEFNNEFFTYMSDELNNTFNDPNIKGIYSDVQQKTPKCTAADKPGVVNVKLLETEKGEKFEDLAMAQIPHAIMQLEDAGFQAKDIAILCRTSDLCKKAADSLLQYKSSLQGETKYVFDIISNEALLLNSRQVIQTIISIIKYVQSPKSKILRTVASCNYLQQQGYSEEDAVRKHFDGYDGIEQFTGLANRPLFDLVEGIISKLPNTGKDIAFIQAFRDCVLEFANSKKSDVGAFLEWWDQYGGDLCINTPDGQNAIRILTIHKSKGLGMPAVILPACVGSMDISSKGSDMLWCEPKQEPFEVNGLVLPVRCSKGLTNTIFKEDYEKERLKAIIDNINTIYVAYTRAQEALVLFAPIAKKDKPSTQEAMLAGYLEKKKYIPTVNNSIRDYVIGQYGRKNDFDKEKGIEIETVLQKGDDAVLQQKLPKLSLKHDKVVHEIEAIERGNCIHEALSVIECYDNIDAPIDHLYASGKMDDKIYSCNEMKEELHNMLNAEDIRPWFKPGLKVLNEKTILFKTKLYDGSDKTMHRPDRVVVDGDKAIVIDFKTGECSKSHHKQVAEYMSFMRDMGFKKVEGFLWYIKPHQVVKVENRGSKKSL